MYDFFKMHGLGNDFVIFDAREQQFNLKPAQIRSLADRQYGVGCDQVIVLENPTLSPADIQMRIFNADGTQAGACGNAARCVTGLSEQDFLQLQVGERLLMCEKKAGSNAKVSMGQALHKIHSDTQVFIDVGNPHMVYIVPDVAKIDLRPQENLNVEWVQVLSHNHLRMRVWERGAGITQACGSGACAAFMAAHLLGHVGHMATVSLDGGDLTVALDNQQNLWLEGPYAHVFRGRITL